MGKDRQHAELARIDSLVAEGLLPRARLLISGDDQEIAQLYTRVEAFVFSPNWVTDSPAQMTRLNLFFVNTSPTLYFVPLTMLATILVWVLLLINKHNEVRSLYRRASLAALALTAVNLFVVGTVVTKLFGTQYLTDPGKLTFLAWEWNVLNVVRMALTATTAGIMFHAFRRLDCVRDQRPAPQH